MFLLTLLILWCNLIELFPLIIEGLLLLVKETCQEDRFFSEFNYLKNVEALMTFKKSCGNTIKFATQNIPHAIIQVIKNTHSRFIYCLIFITEYFRIFKRYN